MTLVPVDPKNEASVIGLLEHAAHWLAEAVHRGDPGEVAAVKAQLATAAEATKQLNLSKEIQLDAQEMVRRAEYALGKAIRKGQADGEVLGRGQIRGSYNRWSGDVHETDNSIKSSPTDFATMNELSGARGDGIYALSDGVDLAEFEPALTEAKAEGNLSRANVVRKIKGRAEGTTLTRQQRADLIADLAAQGYSSRQMPSKVGVTEETVRQIARDFDIEIPADRTVGRTRRINSTQLVENTATALEGLVMGVELIDYAAVDPATASQWVDSLSESMRALNRFVRQIKEQTQ